MRSNAAGTTADDAVLTGAEDPIEEAPETEDLLNIELLANAEVLQIPPARLSQHAVQGLLQSSASLSLVPMTAEKHGALASTASFREV